MRQLLLGTIALRLVTFFAARAHANSPEQTVLSAADILREQTTIPASRIPEALLSEAHGVAIIPNVFKIGFVAAFRRGRGGVMVREPNGAWSLPAFITLTGGSVGWQAGVQGTDVVLVFTTKKSVDGLMSGKFTIGADASASAGPVGRNASAATDARFKAEILSYSRSRGLFAGVALDGSVIDMDPVAWQTFYGVPAGQAPTQIPQSALNLVQEITNLSSTARVAAPGTVMTETSLVDAGPVPQPIVATPREQLAIQAKGLFALLDDEWRKYLALPPEVFSGDNPPTLPALQESLSRYNRVVQNPSFESLYSRPEFQNTYATLRDYAEALAQQGTPALALPPPPAAK